MGVDTLTVKSWKKLETCINDYFEKDMLSNIAIRVGRNDEILCDVYKSKSKQLDKYTLFDMASVTKIVATTTLSLMALDQKRISLDDKVKDYFDCPQDKSNLTIKHLLTHTMGIGHKPLNQEGNTYDNIAEYILSIPSDIPIGSNVLYSCPGFILLGKILEQVFGQSLERLLVEKVSEPLGMYSTSFLPDRSEKIVNSNMSETNIGLVNDYNCRFLGGVCGNAGMFSNILDMTAYIQMLLRRGEPLISREVFDMAIQNYTPNMDESRGLGFLYVDGKYSQTGRLFPSGSIGHCGHTGQSIFIDLESGLYVIILSDATISIIKKEGIDRYEEVMYMREMIHDAIWSDLQSNCNDEKRIEYKTPKC